MSAETKAAVEVALAAHLADQMDSEVMTGYWVVLCGVKLEGRSDMTGYYHMGPDSQPFHTSMGLIEMTRSFLRRDADEGD